MVGFRPAQQLLDEALSFREEYGINTFKLKVGRRPLALDVEACHVLRAGLGPDTELYLDANRGWTANEALEVLRRTADLGLSLLEEPCDAKEGMGRRRLAQKSPSPVVGDESVPTASDASMADDLLAEPIAIHNGRIAVKGAPGVGADVDEDKLARYRQDK